MPWFIGAAAVNTQWAAFGKTANLAQCKTSCRVTLTMIILISSHQWPNVRPKVWQVSIWLLTRGATAATWVLICKLLKLHQLCMILLICPLQILYILHHHFCGLWHALFLKERRERAQGTWRKDKLLWARPRWVNGKGTENRPHGVYAGLWRAERDWGVLNTKRRWPCPQE